jgi:hypothetical protein
LAYTTRQQAIQTLEIGLAGETDLRSNGHKVGIIAGRHNSGYVCAVAFDIHRIGVWVELIAVVVISHNVITAGDLEARAKATAETGVIVVDPCNNGSV